MSNSIMRRLLLILLNLERRRLERRIRKGFDEELSLQLDALSIALEALRGSD